MHFFSNKDLFLFFKKKKTKAEVTTGVSNKRPARCICVARASLIKRQYWKLVIKNFTQGQKTFTNGQLKYNMWYFLQTAARRAFLTLNCRDASEPLGAVKSSRGAQTIYEPDVDLLVNCCKGCLLQNCSTTKKGCRESKHIEIHWFNLYH